MSEPRGVRLVEVRREDWSAGVGHAFSFTLPAPRSSSGFRARRRSDWPARRRRRCSVRAHPLVGGARADRDGRRAAGGGRGGARSRPGALVGCRWCRAWRWWSRRWAFEVVLGCRLFLLAAEAAAGVRDADRGGTRGSRRSTPVARERRRLASRAVQDATGRRDRGARPAAAVRCSSAQRSPAPRRARCGAGATAAARARAAAARDDASIRGVALLELLISSPMSALYGAEPDRLTTGGRARPLPAHVVSPGRGIRVGGGPHGPGTVAAAEFRVTVWLLAKSVSARRVPASRRAGRLAERRKRA